MLEVLIPLVQFLSKLEIKMSTIEAQFGWFCEFGWLCDRYCFSDWEEYAISMVIGYCQPLGTKLFMTVGNMIVPW